jgi:hypothetical protein
MPTSEYLLTSPSPSPVAQQKECVSVITRKDERVQSPDLRDWARNVLVIESKKQRAPMTSLRTLAAARILKQQTTKGLQ